MRSDSHAAVSENRSRVLSKALLRAGDILGLTQASLARIVGLSESSISRLRAQTYEVGPESKSWELAALLVRLYRSLDAITAGDETALRQWMNNPNKDLRGVPAELITTVTGLARVVAYVDAHRARI